MSVFNSFAADATMKAPICYLESLPTDALTAILSECISFEDLHAFIKASPVVLRCFQATKRTIFISILSRFLGPGIRDAVAVALTPQLDGDQEGLEDKASDAIDEYLNLPAGLASIRGLELHNITYLVNFNRTVQFWVNEYFGLRANVFTEYCEGTIKPLSREERHRLAQAFIRYQLFMRLEPDTLMERHTGRPLLQKLMAQYETWELHQVDVVVELFKKVIIHSNTIPYRKPLVRNPSALQLLEWRRQKKQTRIDYLRNIAILRHHDMGIREYGWGCESWRSVERGNVRNLQHRSRRFDRAFLYINYVESSRIGLCWGYFASGFAEHSSVADPPPGWLDALDESNGHICWGMDSLHYDRVDNSLLPGDTGRAVLPFFRWRLLGFMFWDKDRVMQVKEAIIHKYQGNVHM